MEYPVPGSRGPRDEDIGHAGTEEPSPPRLGRRESEPHSAEIIYLHDVLETNFPGDRATWDLHHYFYVDGEKIDIQFDISWIRGLKHDKALSSYEAARFNNKIPSLAVNIFSKSTWEKDIGRHVDEVKKIGIPVYVVFPSYHVATNLYKPPFLRAYILRESGEYAIRELNEITLHEGGEMNWDNTLDCGEHVPFNIGLMERKAVHDEGFSLYRMILLDPTRKKLLFTRREKQVFEKDRAIAEKEKAIAERDEAIAERDEAIAERDEAIAERDKEIEELKNRLSARK